MTIFKVLGLKSIDIYAIPVNSLYIPPSYYPSNASLPYSGKVLLLLYKKPTRGISKANLLLFFYLSYYERILGPHTYTQQNFRIFRLGN